MKYYLEDKFLFIDMHQHYTHCVVEGDRLICCQHSREEAQRVAANIRAQRTEKLNEMKELLHRGHAYMKPVQSAHAKDLRELYPTAGLLNAGIKRVESTIRSIQVKELRVEV